MEDEGVIDYVTAGENDWRNMERSGDWEWAE
jgi:hypothetical protein